MAGPNLINTAMVTGKTAAQAVSTTPATVLTNTTNSGKVIKINVLYIVNSSNSTDSAVTVEFVRNGTTVKIANLSNVAIETTLVVITKDTSIYLEEGDSLQITASVADTLQSLISYEVVG